MWATHREDMASMLAYLCCKHINVMLTRIVNKFEHLLEILNLTSDSSNTTEAQ